MSCSEFFFPKVVIEQLGLPQVKRVSVHENQGNMRSLYLTTWSYNGDYILSSFPYLKCSSKDLQGNSEQSVQSNSALVRIYIWI